MSVAGRAGRFFFLKNRDFRKNFKARKFAKVQNVRMKFSIFEIFVPSDTGFHQAEITTLSLGLRCDLPETTLLEKKIPE